MKIFTIFQMKNKKEQIRKFVIFLFWIMLWQVGALLIQNEILLAGPIDVLKELSKELKEVDFYKSLAFSLFRIMTGFLLGMSSGMLLGAISFFKPIIKEFMAPIVTLLKTIPIASFVVLLLIWAGSKNLSIYISFLVVFPNIYLNTIMGLSNADKKSIEMAQVFQLSRGRRLFYIYLPSLIPFLISSIEISIGMSFKSGVAAEVIGTPKFSFGENLYMSKIHLNTAGVFAWTFVIIFVSYLMEKLVLQGIKKVSKIPVSSKYFKKHMNNEKKFTTAKDIQIKDLSKAYEGKMVLNHINLHLKRGNVYCLMGPSGCGKTTFFHILLGLVRPDEGELIGIKKSDTCAVFQEPRLLEEYSTLNNAFLFGSLSKGVEWEEKELLSLLPKESTYKSAKELSIGMQRRVAILRAMNFDASFIIMDEPFAGLDEKTKEITAAYILKKKGDKTLLISTHNIKDVNLLKGELIDGDKSGFNWDYGRTS
ncbi:MAG: ATP-binding cassette domain-containing protein [Candidatus Galacturonibacter soehngenii]|nr:ATP-binding cassette domain-containing protein [Candidatus Galacturonibacter soehngenii]